MTEVAIIDSGGANIASLRYALDRLACASRLTAEPEDILSSSHVILPGVGAARDAMQRLRRNRLDQLIPRLTQPVLGICLGMQLLFERSEEDDTKCLAVLGGRARRLMPQRGRPVPHMGWNSLGELRDNALLRGISAGAYCYFVHSFAVEVNASTVASTDYGGRFAAIVRRDNFCGTQFHPERSAETGARLLRNFLGLGQ